MNNVFVYCEIEGTKVAEVSQELLTKGRKLANQQGVELHAIVAGKDIKGKVEEQILPYGVDKLFVFDGEGLFPYTSAPHTDILVNLFKEEQPQIALMGATVIGRDLGPRVSSSLTSGLTADCTELEIGDFDDRKAGKHYDGLLYQIRPAFGGNIVATIVNPEHRPQMATVRPGVMQKALYEGKAKGEVVYPEVAKYVLKQRTMSSRCSTATSRRPSTTSRARRSSWLVATAWDQRKTSTCSLSWPTSCMERSAQAARPWTQDGSIAIVRSVRPKHHGPPEGLYRLWHLGTDPAYRRNAGLGHHHLGQHRPRGAHQPHCRLCDHGQRRGGGSQAD